MPVELFAGVAVSHYKAALPWYERLLGAPPAFFPTNTEAYRDPNGSEISFDGNPK